VARQQKGDLAEVIIVFDYAPQREAIMQGSYGLFVLIPAVVLLACVIWLHWRALQDGAIQDVLLFLTGVSIVYYIFSRWDRARLPVAGVVVASAFLVVAAVVSRGAGATWHEPSPEELAAEVKPLILQEWKKHPDLERATIQSISLARKGEGVYSGSLEAILDGRAVRLALEVVLDGETIKWEIKPGGS
jgi:hypothetical protein